MPNKHEPNPRFVDSLEWQLGRELRRSKVDTAQRPFFRNLKIAALMLGSVAVGAVVMGASQQLKDSWRTELLESRLEVQLQLAQQRLDTQLDAVGLTREQVAQGLETDEKLIYHEFKIAEAEADAMILELELEEIRRSGREPLGELSSALVDGRDFVSEKIEAKMDVAHHRLDVVKRAQGRIQQRVELGVVNERELQAQQLLAMEAELQLVALAEQLEVRREFLDSEISAVEAELEFLQVEAQNRVVLLDQRREYFQLELERYQALIESGTISPAAAAEIRTQLDEIEAELRSALEEQRIVREELERRAEER